MDTLEPLNIEEDRTLEQKLADGDWNWQDAPPIKLPKPAACALCLQETGEWTGPAWWVCNGSSLCDACIMRMIEQLPDNRAWLAEVLADIRERRLQVESRVRILLGDEQGNLGTVYNHAPGRPAPWHVRPDRWPADCPGIAFQADELDVML